MHVPVHTNQVGRFSLYARCYSAYRIEPHNWVFGYADKIVSFSNKPSIIQGSPPIPTNYWRKCWTVRAGGYDVNNYHAGRWGSKGDARAYGGFRQINAGSDMFTALTAVPDWLVNEAISSCHDKMREFRTLLLEELAQAKSNAKLLFSILKGIVSVVRSIRRANLKQAVSDASATLRHVLGSGYVTKAQDKRIRRWARKAARLPKSSINDYLAWRYGVLPLISTFEALASTSATSRVKTKTVSSKKVTSADPLAFTITTGAYTTGGKAEYTALASMTADIHFSAFENLGNQLGLTTWDVVASLWAITPYSFVVDWFIPVQQWLQNQSFTGGVTFKHGFVTKRHTCDASFETRTGISYSDRNSVGVWPSWNIKAIHMVRDASIRVPPGVGLSFKTVLSSTNQLDGLALALKRVM